MQGEHRNLCTALKAPHPILLAGSKTAFGTSLKPFRLTAEDVGVHHTTTCVMTQTVLRWTTR